MREIPLTQGYTALVSDRDYARVVAAGPWCAHVTKRKDGSVRSLYAKHAKYQSGTGKQVLVWLHRFILGIADSNIKADHRDHDGLNCQRRNLRRATRKDNCRNLSTPITNTSGYKGVHWETRSNKWKAQIWHGTKREHLGYFSTAKAAATAYDKAARRLFGKFACTNF
jgi:hypothetical protein